MRSSSSGASDDATKLGEKARVSLTMIVKDERIKFVDVSGVGAGRI